VLATPIRLGQPSSLSTMVLERLDAELGETDDEGRLLTFGKVAAVAVVGNEDGAHHVIAECPQALNDTGFSVAANAGTYRVGEAMHGTDYQDLDQTPDEVAAATRTLAANARTSPGCSRPARSHQGDRQVAGWSGHEQRRTNGTHRTGRPVGRRCAAAGGSPVGPGPADPGVPAHSGPGLPGL
jgi:multimeric flavodoxin WrbA